MFSFHSDSESGIIQLNCKIEKLLLAEMNQEEIKRCSCENTNTNMQNEYKWPIMGYFPYEEIPKY